MQIDLYDRVPVKDNVLIIGKQGSGKTTFVKRNLAKALESTSRLRPDVLIMTNRKGEYRNAKNVNVVTDKSGMTRAIDSMIKPRMNGSNHHPLIVVLDQLYWTEMEMRDEAWYGPFMKGLYEDRGRHGVTIITVASDSFHIHKSIVNDSSLKILCKSSRGGYYSARELSHAEALRIFNK